MFPSKSAEIRYYIKEYLSDGEAHSIAEIKDYVRTHSANSNNFTEGMYTGAFRDIVTNESDKYHIPMRGYYQKTSSNNSVIRNRLLDIIEKTISELYKACDVNILEVSDRDLSVSTQINELINDLKRHKEKLQNG